eukprot:250593_1
MVDLTEVIFRFIKRFKLFIIIFWTILAVLSCFYGLDLPNQTVFQFLPPKGSESDIAYNEMQKYFPEFLFIDTEVIIVEAKWDITDNHTILNKYSNQIYKLINDSIWNKVNPKYNLLMDIQSYYSTANVSTNTITVQGQNYSIQSYIDMAKKPKYIDRNQDVMLIYIQSNINGASTQTLNGFIAAVKTELNEINSQYTDYDITLTGGITIFQECMDAISHDMTSKDIVVMPLIFCFMIYMIGSWKLIILPAISLGMTIIISFGIFYPFAIYLLQVNPSAPSIMMFLSMALSIDYSMFLLSRFALERKNGKSVNNSVKGMIKYSGHVVCLSGIVLIVCYLALVLFPIAGMETVGYGAAVTIFICILVNITMSSSIILQFPNCFGKLETFPSYLVRCVAKICPYNRCKKYKTYGLEIRMQNNENLLVINESGPRDNSRFNIVQVDHIPYINDDDIEMLPMDIVDNNENNYDNDSEIAARNNCYFKLAQYTTRWPYKCIVPLFIYAAMIPVIYQLSYYSPSIDFTFNFPTNADSVNAYDVLINDFNPGDMAPMYILVVSKQNNIWTQEYFNALCEIGNALIDSGDENNTQIISMGFMPDTDHTGGIKCVEKLASIKLYETLINNPSLIIGNNTNSKYWNYYMKWFNNTVNNPQQTVSIILAIPNFNPYTGSALENCEKYRDVINEVKNRENIEAYVDVYLHQSLYWEIDGLHRTNEILPYGLAIIIGIVFLLIGIVFKTIFLPFRLLLCIVIPILFVYGLSVGVFQNNWLGWTQFHSLQSTNGIGWMLPVITCTVLVGLALDYEIFLFSRVFEYRSKGYTISASIILG